MPHVDLLCAKSRAHITVRYQRCELVYVCVCVCVCELLLVFAGVCELFSGEDGSQDEGIQEPDICGSINTADIHEIVVTRVNETLTAYKNAQGEADSPVIKQLVPALATAAAVAVSEAMKGVMKTMASLHSHGTSAMSTATENRLLAAVTSLTVTYENDRLQQYSRRESVRIFGIRQAERETAEQVEQKALGVFKEAGADVKEEGIAAVHRVGKVGRGLRPILVKFVSRRKRREVMEKKSLKGKDGYQKVYTPTTTSLLCGPNCWLW